jgi:hypothetical protein
MSLMVAMSAWRVPVKKERKALTLYKLTPEEAREFRIRAEEAVDNAPAAFRYNVWKGVNARLEEHGLEPIPKPDDLVEDDPLSVNVPPFGR